MQTLRKLPIVSPIERQRHDDERRRHHGRRRRRTAPGGSAGSGASGEPSPRSRRRSTVPARTRRRPDRAARRADSRPRTSRVPGERHRPRRAPCRPHDPPQLVDARPSRRADAAGAARPCASTRSRPTRQSPGTAVREALRWPPCASVVAASGFRNQARARQPAALLEPLGGGLVVVQRPVMDEADVLHVLPLRRACLRAPSSAAQSPGRAGPGPPGFGSERKIAPKR